MKIKTGIEKAIGGGWLKGENPEVLFGAIKVNPHNATLVGTNKTKETDGYQSYNLYRILLDPSFWEALAKAEGWAKTGDGNKLQNRKNYFGYDTWIEKHHRFLDLLHEGQDISTAFDNATK